MNTKFKSSMVMRTLRILIIVLVIGGFASAAFGEHYWYGIKDFGIYTGGETTCGPTFVGFNTKLYYFFKKVDNTISYMRSDDGGFIYYGFYTCPGTTSHSVAGEVFNGKMYVVYKSATTNDIYLTNSTDGSTWSTPAVITGKTTSVAPALTVFNSKLQLVTKGATNNNIYVCATSDGTTWSTSYQVPNATTPEYPSTTVFNGKIYVAFKGDGNNNIYIMNSTTGQTTWSAPYAVPSIATLVTPSIHTYRDRMYLVHKSTGGTTLYYNYTTDGSTWTAATQPAAYYDSTHAAGLEVFNNKLWFAIRGPYNDNHPWIGKGYETVLPVPLYAQQTTKWCWAASGEMLMTYLGATVDVTQCRQANNRFARTDCCNNFANCVQGGLVEFYKYGFNYSYATNLTFDQFKAEIQNNRPVGFVHQQNSDGYQHYMVARGYSEAGGQFVCVNDPWPSNVTKTAGGAQRIITYAEWLGGAGYTNTMVECDYNIVKL
ncbi:MAG: C39 family peptidase [Acidobacteria bacterium]|nr:C39 family peptidase [Acidobacteriota bacterium]